MESKAWGGLAPAERGRIMNRMAGAAKEPPEELATLQKPDMASPCPQARTERPGPPAVI